MAHEPPLPPVVQEPPIEEDSYHSSSDEDFDANAPQDGPSSSEDELAADANKRPKKKRKIAKDNTNGGGGAKGGDGEDYVMDMEDLDSGDEAMIRRGERKMARRKKGRGKGKGKGVEGEDGGDVEGESSGGEGGVVRTRLMRAKEKVDSKRQVNKTASNINVDALWAQMNSAGDTTPDAAKEDADDDTSIQEAPPAPNLPSRAADEETITFQRTTRFAGETTTETITVPLSSETAKLHLASLAATSTPKAQQTATTAAPPSRLRRPLARLSAFDPNPPQKYPRPFSTAKNINTADTELTAKAVQGDKINTVDKSKMDWAKYVDQEGIQEELVKGGRAKESYIARRGFLDDVERRRDEELVEARRARRG